MAGRSRSCTRWRLITGLLRTLPSRDKGIPERVVFSLGIGPRSIVLPKYSTELVFGSNTGHAGRPAPFGSPVVAKFTQ